MIELLAYESTPLNAAEFARLAEVSLREVRSLSQLRQAVETSDRSTLQVIAIEVTQESLVEVVSLIRWLRLHVKHQAISTAAGDSVRPAVIAMPDSTVQHGVHALYEAGTDLIFRTMLDRDKVALLIGAVRSRNEAICENSGPTGSDGDFRMRIWSKMPWKRMATGGSR